MGAFKECDIVGWVPCMAHVIHNTIRQGIKHVEKITDLLSKMRRIVHHCHTSPDTLTLIKGNEKWLDLPELTLISESPTRWNSFLDCGERLLQIQTQLNVALYEKPQLLLDKDEILLIEDIVEELKPFRSITNMLCSNTTFTWNKLWPMKEYIEDMLDKAVDKGKTTHHATIKKN